MRKIIPLILISVVFVACSSIDCPLNSTVYTHYSLKGNVSVLTDTLTISTEKYENNDTVLINKDVNTDSFYLPMSYQRAQDVLYFDIKSQDGTRNTIDTVTVYKENTPHFESIDCNPAFFHTITNVEYTNNRIDSIVIKNKNVNYDATKAHFYIYFKKSDN